MVPLSLKPKRMSTLSVVPTSCCSVTVRLFRLSVSSLTVAKLPSCNSLAGT